jgi:hypothetical protein
MFSNLGFFWDFGNVLGAPVPQVTRDGEVYDGL